MYNIFKEFEKCKVHVYVIYVFVLLVRVQVAFLAKKLTHLSNNNTVYCVHKPLSIWGKHL